MKAYLYDNLPVSAYHCCRTVALPKGESAV